MISLPYKNTSSQVQTLYILGAGAIGQLFAARFMELNDRSSQSIYFITFLTKQKSQASSSFCFKNLQGESSYYQAEKLEVSDPILDNISQLIICTKSQQTIKSFELLAPRLQHCAQVILLQNGLGNHHSIDEILKSTSGFKGQLFLASTTEGAFRQAQQHTIHTGLGQTDIGLFRQYSQASISEAPPCILALNNVHYKTNIEEIIWQKLFINCVINPLTVKYNCLNGELLNTDNIELQVFNICQEVACVAKALSLFHKESLPVLTERMKKLVLEVIVSTAKNSSSMREDVKAKRATEIDYINGYIVKMGSQLSLPCPHNTALTQLVKHITDKVVPHE